MTQTWLKAALIRALRTVAQAALGIIGPSTLLGDVNWAIVISGSLLAGFVALLMSVAGLPEVKLQKALQEAECSTPAPQTDPGTVEEIVAQFERQEAINNDDGK